MRGFVVGIRKRKDDDFFYTSFVLIIPKSDSLDLWILEISSVRSKAKL